RAARSRAWPASARAVAEREAAAARAHGTLEWMRVLLLVVAMTSVAHADRELCTRGAQYHGPPVHLALTRADIHQVYRLLSDVGRVNIVISDQVQGKVTMKLKRVPWDQAACTVAAVHKLVITVQGNVLLVMPQAGGG